MKIVSRFEGNPDHVFVPHFLDGHRDHRDSNLVLDEIKGNPMVWAYQGYSVLPPNVCVDITKSAPSIFKAEAKITSQPKEKGWRHFHDGILIYNTRWLSRKDTSDERYVEAFFRIPLEEYSKWVQKTIM